MRIKQLLCSNSIEAIKSLYGKEISAEKVQVQKTRPEFEGDLTIVVFPFLQLSKKPPEQTANDLGNWLISKMPELVSFNVIKGFLNLVIADKFWIESLLLDLFEQIKALNADKLSSKASILLEYSSPNTNKPLHLGHIRNNLLGYSLASILEKSGHSIIKTQIINDRGIHICKSMLAWQKWGKGETPVSSGLKGDKLVGKYYVLFDKEYKEQIKQGIANGLKEDQAAAQSELIREAQEMLRKWEAKDPEIIALWTTMNSWVYEGFNETYKTLGVNFDRNYYESETYLYGKKIVEKGLKDGIFYQKEEDKSVWCDLKNEGMDDKLLIRSDGTTVYITQDIGTAIRRFEDYPEISQQIYTVGNEQDHHFKVLFAILKKLGYHWADKCYHLSYGMVDLPSGKMKSREGTVVDADDLIREMISTAKKTSEELGKLNEIPEEKREELFRILGLGAIKYFILKVDPKKRMLFDPVESIDLNGNTGPFIQYTYARIQSLLRKGNFQAIDNFPLSVRDIHKVEKQVLILLYEFPEAVKDAGDSYNPAVIANYVYELVKEYNHFYQTCPVLSEPDRELLNFRLILSQKTGEVIKSSMKLLGIEVPEKM